MLVLFTKYCWSIYLCTVVKGAVQVFKLRLYDQTCRSGSDFTQTIKFPFTFNSESDVERHSDKTIQVYPVCFGLWSIHHLKGFISRHDFGSFQSTDLSSKLLSQ